MSTHYYTLKNNLTGEPTLVHAKNRAQAERGFFARRFSVELTTQQDMVKFLKASVAVLDLTEVDSPPCSTAPSVPATQHNGTPQTLMEGASSLTGAPGINGSASPVLDT